MNATRSVISVLALGTIPVGGFSATLQLTVLLVLFIIAFLVEETANKKND